VTGWTVTKPPTHPWAGRKGDTGRRRAENPNGRDKPKMGVYLARGAKWKNAGERVGEVGLVVFLPLEKTGRDLGDSRYLLGTCRSESPGRLGSVPSGWPGVDRGSRLDWVQ
jgi:hypothetical protein